MFRTPWLRLRAPVAADATALFSAYTTDLDVLRYLTWRPHADLADTVASIRKWTDDWREGRSFPFVISDVDERGPPFGMIHLRRQDDAVSFGYVLERSRWGRGFASEALTALVNWSLSQPGICRAAAHCDIDNLASARVMEKARLRFEGVLKRHCRHPNVSAELRDAMIFARTR